MKQREPRLAEPRRADQRAWPTSGHPEARAYEELISQAPEQWTAVFFPIWPDLVAGAATADASATEGTDEASTSSAPPTDAAAAAATEGAR